MRLVSGGRGAIGGSAQDARGRRELVGTLLGRGFLRAGLPLPDAPDKARADSI